MYRVKAISAGPFGTNTYLFGLEGKKETILIDAPPSSYGLIMTEVSKAGLSLSALIITHPHFDHTLDASIFSNSGIPVYAHPDAIEGIQKPETFGLIPKPAEGFPECPGIIPLEMGKSLNLAGMQFECLDVPGHSDGSVALYLSGHCFVGDVIFQSSIGRTDLPGGSLDVLTESIQTRLYVLPDETVLYPGHGPTTKVGNEKLNNPFVQG